MALYAALGAVVAAVAVGLLVSYALGAAVLLLGAAVALVIGRESYGMPKVELFYNLDAEAEARFSEVRAACEALAGSEKVWRVDGEGETAEVSESISPDVNRSPDARVVIQVRVRCTADEVEELGPKLRKLLDDPSGPRG